jgi:hypothetical protein
LFHDPFAPSIGVFPEVKPGAFFSFPGALAAAVTNSGARGAASEDFFELGPPGAAWISAPDAANALPKMMNT